MWRPLALVFLARVFSGCGTDAPDGIAERNEDKGQMCRAAEILVQAPDSMRTVRLDFGLGDREMRVFVAHQLALDTCRDLRFALELPTPVQVEEDLSVSSVRCTMEFDCGAEYIWLRHETRFTILVNRQGHFLANGEVVILEQLLDRFEEAIRHKNDEDDPLMIVLDWRHSAAEVMESLLSGLVRRYWATMLELAGRHSDSPLCDLSERLVTDYFVETVFLIRLLPRYPPPPTTARIRESTICVEPTDSLN